MREAKKVLFGLVGCSSQETSYGHIEVKTDGSGDTATITFTDHNDRNKETASLKIYNLKELKESDDFKNTQEDEKAENLLNTWKTRRSPNKIIKYAGDDQLALVLTSDSNLDEVVEKLFSSNSFEFSRVDYINERNFVQALQKKGSTIQELAHIPGMNKERLELLSDQANKINQFLDRGITLNELGQIDFKKLEYLLNSYSKVSKLLNQGVTLNDLDKIDLNKLEYLLSNYSEVSELSNQGVVLNGVTLNDLDKIDLNKLEDLLGHHSKTNRLLERGFTLNDLAQMDSKKLENLFDMEYRLDELLKFVTIQQILGINHIPPKIPNEEKNERAALHSGTFQNDQEVKFVNFLQKHETSIGKLQQLPGMTRNKLITLMNNTPTVRNLLEKGMTFDDFAKTDAARLRYVFAYFYQAEHALKLVEPKELFGLNCPPDLQHRNTKPTAANYRFWQPRNVIALATATAAVIAVACTQLISKKR